MRNQKKKSDKDVVASPEHIETTHISPEVAKIIETLQPDQRRVIIQAFRQEAFSGPIPHPELLQKYENIQKGFADRIITMAETQLGHRVRCEDKIVDGSVKESKRGQNYALIVAILFLAGAVYLGINDHEWLAGVLGGGTLAAIVAIFVTGKRNKD